MTLQALIFMLKEDGRSDNFVKVAICTYLHERGYKISEVTYAVIDKYLLLYVAWAKSANERN